MTYIFVGNQLATFLFNIIFVYRFLSNKSTVGLFSLRILFLFIGRYGTRECLTNNYLLFLVGTNDLIELLIISCVVLNKIILIGLKFIDIDILTMLFICIYYNRYVSKGYFHKITQ